MTGFFMKLHRSKQDCSALPGEHSEEGTVLEVHAVHVLIATEPAMMCAGCSGRKACGYNDKTHKRVLSAMCEISVSTGDLVLFIPGRSPLLLATLIYLVPLLLFVSGVVLFINLDIFDDNDLNGIIGGLSGLVLSGFTLYLGNKRFSKNIKARVIAKK